MVRMVLLVTLSFHNICNVVRALIHDAIRSISSALASKLIALQIQDDLFDSALLVFWLEDPLISV